MSQPPAASSGEGSRTVTGTAPVAGPSNDGVLRLRGAEPRRRRVVWSEGTVDNEGLGKKKSKICCIYHKPRAFDESSSEEESSGEESSSDSDSSASEHECNHKPKPANAKKGDKDHPKEPERRPNAYEKT